MNMLINVKGEFISVNRDWTKKERYRFEQILCSFIASNRFDNFDSLFEDALILMAE